MHRSRSSRTVRELEQGSQNLHSVGIRPIVQNSAQHIPRCNVYRLDSKEVVVHERNTAKQRRLQMGFPDFDDPRAVLNDAGQTWRFEGQCYAQRPV